MINMHASSFDFLISLMLLVFSYIQIQLLSPTLVQARTLTSNNNGAFKVDLIHRDSPLSPYYNSSIPPQERVRKPRLSNSISRGHGIHPSSAYSEDINNYVYSAALNPDHGDYLMKISIGTPPMEFVANADTGSSLVWLQCSPCQLTRSCVSEPSPSFFDPSQSSTYQPIPCNSQTCNSPNYNLQCPSSDISSTDCSYDAGYGGGLESSGTIATDTISFPASPSLNFPAIFGCGFNQQFHGDQNSIPGDGIVGLGAGTLSLVSQLGPKINNRFSYCLAPLSASVTSRLTFGSDVTGSGAVSTPFTTLNPPDNYILTLDSISIGDNSIPVAQNVVIDSGSTLTSLPSDVYESIKSALSDAIQLSPASDTDDSLCYEAELSDQGFNPPDVVFHFQGNADVVLQAINTFWTPQTGLVCLTIRPSDNSYIFGNTAQVNFEVGYDLQAQQVSFAPADCSN